MLSLQGHDNWVRSLDFATFTKDSTNDDTKQQKETDGKNTSHHHTLQDGDLLLASGSQDKYIRIWRISAVADAPEQVSAEEATAQAGSDAALTQDMLKSLEEMYVSGGLLLVSCWMSLGALVIQGKSRNFLTIVSFCYEWNIVGQSQEHS